jgi:hypothetical protein
MAISCLVSIICIYPLHIWKADNCCKLRSAVFLRYTIANQTYLPMTLTTSICNSSWYLLQTLLTYIHTYRTVSYSCVWCSIPKSSCGSYHLFYTRFIMIYQILDTNNGDLKTACSMIFYKCVSEENNHSKAYETFKLVCLWCWLTNSVSGFHIILHISHNTLYKAIVKPH